MPTKLVRGDVADAKVGEATLAVSEDLIPLPFSLISIFSLLDNRNDDGLRFSGSDFVVNDKLVGGGPPGDENVGFADGRRCKKVERD
jgi:hypothetical protein